jgi:hypothetical protein
MRRLAWLLPLALAGCETPRTPERPPVQVEDTTTYDEPPMFDSAPPPAARRTLAALNAPVLRSAPIAYPVVDTVHQADGHVIATTYVMTPVVKEVDTLAVPPPVPTGPTTALLGLSYSPTIAAPDPYGFSLEGVNPGTIIQTLKEIREGKRFVVLNMMGGSHAKYRSPRTCKPTEKPCYPEVFDMAKWTAGVKGYDTPAIREALHQASMWILWISVMDEPANTSLATNAYWGPPGTFTRARVGELCRTLRTVVPDSIPLGVVQDPRNFDTKGTYPPDCAATLAQYRSGKDEITEWISRVKSALSTSPNIHLMLAMNTVHGGTPSTTCQKYGDDPSGKLCPMTAKQIRDFGRLLMTSASCGGVNTWRFQPGYTDKPDIAQALKDLATYGATLPPKPCR